MCLCVCVYVCVQVGLLSADLPFGALSRYAGVAPDTAPKVNKTFDYQYGDPAEALAGVGWRTCVFPAGAPRVRPFPRFCFGPVSYVFAPSPCQCTLSLSSISRCQCALGSSPCQCALKSPLSESRVLAGASSVSSPASAPAALFPESFYRALTCTRQCQC